jgi:hypothetical protein
MRFQFPVTRAPVMLSETKHLDVVPWNAGAPASNEPVRPPSLIGRRRCACIRRLRVEILRSTQDDASM